MISLSDIATIERSESSSLDDLERLFDGQIFHVTHIENLTSIFRAGGISPGSIPGSKQTFGERENAFFGNRNCVSLFDYRTTDTPAFKEHSKKCRPFMPARPPSPGIAVLFVAPSVIPRLVPWTKWRDEGAYAEAIVPVVEIGHRDVLYLQYIYKGFALTLTEDKTAFVAQFRRSTNEES